MLAAFFFSVKLLDWCVGFVLFFFKDVGWSVGSFPGVGKLIVDSSDMRLIRWLISDVLLALPISYFFR